jgi:hypothetical protein
LHIIVEKILEVLWIPSSGEKKKKKKKKTSVHPYKKTDKKEKENLQSQTFSDTIQYPKIYPIIIYIRLGPHNP